MILLTFICKKEMLLSLYFPSLVASQLGFLCYLSIISRTRELIQSIQGVRLVELPNSQEKCYCCGGGGNLEMIDAELSAEITKRKIDEVLQTGAQAVVTACQQCVRTMTTYVRRNKVPLEVMDITQLVHRALRG